MSSILLKNATLQDGSTGDLLVEGGRIATVHAAPGTSAGQTVDCSGMAVLPAFYNTHTHAAMSLLRGYADDLPLQTWLQDHIWPYEDTLTPGDIRKGSAAAIREMVRCGCVFFNDMYFDVEETIAEVEKAGVRACIGITFMDNHSKALREQKAETIRQWRDRADGRITIAAAPHAIYTAGPDTLLSAAALAREKGIRLHIHLAETRQEVEDCLRDHGTTPVRYLDSLGFLGPDVVAAHCVWVDDGEWEILRRRGVTVSHCPCSNMKLGSGRFPYEKALRSGVKVTLGTDGNSSNNNLDLREEMKFAALLAKVEGDATLLSAPEVLSWATQAGAQAFGLDAGVIADGKLADLLLVRLDHEKMQPCHNVISNWVYSADSGCIDSVMCDGKFLMRNKEILF